MARLRRRSPVRLHEPRLPATFPTVARRGSCWGENSHITIRLADPSPITANPRWKANRRFNRRSHPANFPAGVGHPHRVLMVDGLGKFNFRLMDQSLFRTMTRFFQRNRFETCSPQCRRREPARIIYSEKYHDKSLALAVSLLPEEAKLYGPAVTLWEGGTPHVIAFYKNNELEGPLRVYSKEGDLEIFGVFKSGNRNGIFARFVNGWPVFLQQWKSGKPLAGYLIVGNSAIVAPVAEMPPLDCMSDLAGRQLQDLIDQILTSEKELRRSILAWYREELKKGRQQRSRVNSTITRNQTLRQIEAGNAGAMGEFLREYQQTVDSMLPR